MMCNNCEMENALPSDKECWHCGKPLLRAANCWTTGLTNEPIPVCIGMTITVRLTEAEANALLFAAGNILDAGGEDEVLEFYAGNKQDRNAAFRGRDKIRNALRGKSSNDKLTHGGQNQ